MTIVILLAAGSGTRFEHSVPKQLIELNKRPLIEHSLDVFCTHPKIDEVIIVTSKELLDPVKRLSKPYSAKVQRIIKGGSTRSESSFLGLEAIQSRDNPKVLIHDAARPFVSPDMITGCVNALDQYDAVSVVVPAKETIFKVIEGRVKQIPDRNFLMTAQTPQGFRLETIKKGYEKIKDDSLSSLTDNCGVIAKYLPDTPIGVIEGTEKNLKITYPVDILMAQAISEEM